MKKSFLVLLIVSAISGVWWKIHTPENASTHSLSAQKQLTPEEILENDYKKIAKNLKPENTSSQEWAKINNYSLAPSALVNESNASHFFKVAQSNIPDIYSCLKKDFCGMKTRNADDAYFDDQRTPAHILIERNLKIMKESLQKNDQLRSEVDWELMQDLALADNEALSPLALDIIREFNTDAVKTDELIKMTEEYKGAAKAEALLSLSKRNNKTDKILLANEVEEVFSKADPHTVISVLEKMKRMAFSETQATKILSYLCSFKEATEEDYNWLRIKYEARKINENFERNCN